MKLNSNMLSDGIKLSNIKLSYEWTNFDVYLHYGHKKG